MPYISIWKSIALAAFVALVSPHTALAQAGGAAESWLYDCPTVNAKKVCRIIQNLSMKKGDQQRPLLSIMVRPDKGAKNHALYLALPHGIFLPAGVEIAVDNEKPVRLAFHTSDTKGIYAGLPISDGMLAALKKGIKMNVIFVSMQKKKIGVPVSLKGFTAAYERL